MKARELAASQKDGCCKIAITLIDAVVSPAPLCVAQKPIAACDGKQLKLNDQGRAVFGCPLTDVFGRWVLGLTTTVESRGLPEDSTVLLEQGDSNAVPCSRTHPR